MSNGALQFSIGLQNSDFVTKIKQSEQEISGLNTSLSSSTRSMIPFIRGVHEGGEEALGMREKTEILKHSLESMGGSFGVVGDLARMMLDPMTIGFAAVFGMIELVNRSLEKSAEEMRNFIKEGVEVESIVKGIISARPTQTQEWTEWLAKMGKLSEHPADVKTFADNSNEVQKEVDRSAAEATQMALNLELKKTELLRDQARISQADAAKRIQAIKDQMVLQKNLAEQITLKDQIKGRESDLAEINRQARQAPEGAATTRKQKADASVSDLQKQIEDIPKAIAGEKKLQKEGEENANFFHLSPYESGEWLNQAEAAKARQMRLQAQLEAAKSQLPGAIKEQTSANENFQNSQNYQDRGRELKAQISELKNQLGTTLDRQRRMTPLEMQQNAMEAAATEKKEQDKAQSGRHVEFTSFEKMGFVMGNNSNFMKRSEGYLQQIVRNTSVQGAFYSVQGQFDSV